jgi:uncharacterized protein (TIGR02246 family)
MQAAVLPPIVATFRRFVACALVVFAPCSATAQDLTATTLETWLAKYERAWETRDADQAAQLFTETATYRETPFDEPMTGRAAIESYWTSVTADQRAIDFESDVIAVQGNVGVAHWSARFEQASSGAMVELDGVFVLTFDSSGLCVSLREWWHLPQ